MRQLSVAVLGLVLATMLLGGRGLGSGSILAQDASPAASPGSCPVTTEEENAALVERFMDEVYNAHDPARAAEFLARDFNRSNPARPHVNEPGHADDIARIERSVAEFPDLSSTIEQVIADDDLVVVLTTLRGTHQGNFEDLGAPATGVSAEWSAVFIWRIACGKLAENWVTTDRLSQYRQLGIITEEELATVDTPAMATPEP
jgi:steroid delta-isomerase-like uncharacterized protein